MYDSGAEPSGVKVKKKPDAIQAPYYCSSAEANEVSSGAEQSGVKIKKELDAFDHWLLPLLRQKVARLDVVQAEVYVVATFLVVMILV